MEKNPAFAFAINSFMRSKSMNWFLYDRDLRHERVNAFDVSEHFSKHIRTVLIETKIKFFFTKVFFIPKLLWIQIQPSNEF